MNSTVRQIVFWVLIIGGAFLLYMVFNGKANPKDARLNYPQLLQKAQDKQITSATIQGTVVASHPTLPIRLLGPIKIEGTLRAESGGAVFAQAITNLAVGVFSGAQLDVAAGSRIRLASPITTNAGAIRLDGPDSNLYVGETGTTRNEISSSLRPL